MDTKRKSETANNPTSSKMGRWISPGPGYAAHRERVKTELRFINKWEWSDEDLLFSCQEFLLQQITKEDALKELPILRCYLKQEHQSECFDIDVRPKIGIGPPGIYPILRTEKELQRYKDLAELAIESFVKENDKTDYEVIKVVKANVCSGSCDRYYLTFIAKDVSPRGRYRSPKTFQAIVIVPAYQPEIPAEAKLCRIKPRS